MIAFDGSYALNQIDFRADGSLRRLQLSSLDRDVTITFEEWRPPALDLRPGQPLVMLDPVEQPQVTIESRPR